MNRVFKNQNNYCAKKIKSNIFEGPVQFNNRYALDQSQPPADSQGQEQLPSYRQPTTRRPLPGTDGSRAATGNADLRGVADDEGSATPLRGSSQIQSWKTRHRGVAQQDQAAARGTGPAFSATDDYNMSDYLKEGMMDAKGFRGSQPGSVQSKRHSQEQH